MLHNHDYIWEDLWEDAPAGEHLEHIGNENSGRYPRGSGKDPYQHEPGHNKGYNKPRHPGAYDTVNSKNKYKQIQTKADQADKMMKNGVPMKEACRQLGISINELKSYKSVLKKNEMTAKIAQIERYMDMYNGNKSEVARAMGINESNVRYLLDKNVKERTKKKNEIVDVLREEVRAKQFLDVGKGVERHLDITETRKKRALQELEAQGYSVHQLRVEQMGTANKTTVHVLAAPGLTIKDCYDNLDKIGTIDYKAQKINGEKEFFKMEYPTSVDSKRIKVRYAEEGGTNLDGLIQIRRGMEDVNLGKNAYAQVRIAVDGTHYMKGMCVYKDDMPPGVDIIYNSNKHVGAPKDKVFKKLDDDPTNPFGSSIQAQMHYTDKNGKEQLSPVNIMNQEGDWAKWKKSLPSQMLSKQPQALVKQQLTEKSKQLQSELDDIMALTNPIIKKKMLLDYADGRDSDAVKLSAAAMPRQASKVIIPSETLKPNEVYAPGYKNGETVVAIRYPHGGKFEIPTLIVNNNNPECKAMLGNAIDAIAIHHQAAERLSGADFDGDTVTLIPNNNGAIKTEPALKGLAGYDPKDKYQVDYQTMNKKTRGLQMGTVTNLIADMTAKGAEPEEMARAVRHSMCVIDAYKHKLDYKQSYEDENIKELHIKYQGKATGGASTIMTRAGSKDRNVAEYRNDYKIDPKTGEKILIYTGKGKAKYDKVDANGNLIKKDRFVLDATGRKVKGPDGKYLKEPNPEYAKAAWTKTGFIENKTPTARMAMVKDAMDLVGNKNDIIELEYAKFANDCKAKANKARLEYLNTKGTQYDPEAAKKYAAEVSSLNAKLNLALKNAPIERLAQIKANVMYREKYEKYGDNWDEDDIRKQKGRALNAARAEVGASKQYINPTDREWEAIQAGAFKPTKAEEILKNADSDRIKSLATPKERKTVTPAQISSIKSLNKRGSTLSEIAEHLGLSVSQVERVLYS